MSKLSFSEVVNKRNGFEQILNSDREYNFNLVYVVNKNLKRAEEEIKDIRDLMPDDDEDFLEYNSKRFQLAEEMGAEIATTQDGRSFVQNTEDMNVDEFEKRDEELKEDYLEAIERQKEVNEERQKIVDEHVIEIDWKPLKKEHFPKDIKPKELPIAIMDLIEE